MRGTKEERSPGVWRLRVFIGSDPVTGNPRQATRTFRGTKKQADSALAEFVRDLGRGEVSTDRSTLAEFLDRWLEHIAGSRSPTTVRGYRDKIRRIDEKLGGVRLSKLTAHQLDRAYRSWLDEGLHPTTVHHLHGVLSAALNQAVKWGIVPVAVTGQTSPPPLRTKPKAIPSPEVIQRLIAVADGRGQPVLAAVIAVAATTGARRGELLGLRWSDVDLDGGVLHIRRAVKHADGSGWVVGEIKTHAQRRIALDGFSVEVFRRQREASRRRAADARVAFDPEGYVFTFDPTGATPMKPDSLGQAFGRLCAREGVSGVSLHTLRHFSASVLVASGRDVRTIAGRLGHADATTTLRVYSHMVEGLDRDAAEFLGGILASGDRAALDTR
ncbi:MAG TPA: site-specific integrase [Acidimicrobiales bacterium]|nr:site-specific integrase [Acidimicrobiales bacterium]